MLVARRMAALAHRYALDDVLTARDKRAVLGSPGRGQQGENYG